MKPTLSFMMKYLRHLLRRTEGFKRSGLLQNSIPLTLSILTLIITLSGGCEDEPDVLGLDLLPDSIRAYVNNAEIIQAYTREGDSLVSNRNSQFIMGSHIHPVFGQTIASLVTEMSLIEYESYSFGTDPVQDSVILRFDFSGYTGDPLSTLMFHVYEYEEELRTDTNFYSNTDVDGKFNPAVLGTGQINYNDSIIKIFIEDQDFIDKFLLAPDSTYKTNDNFQTYIRGLYIVPELISGEGAVVKLDFVNYPGVLGIYYRNAEEDSLDYFLEVGGGTSKELSLFEYDLSGSPLEENLNNGDGPDSLVYIASPGVVNAIISFPELESWRDSMPIAINHAQLIITPLDTLSSSIKIQDYPALLELLRYGSDGVNRYVYDYMLNSSTYGGSYDSETNSYSFNLKVHLQSYLNGDLDNVDLILRPGSNAETYNQLILYGGTSNHSGRMRLEIVYTVL